MGLPRWASPREGRDVRPNFPFPEDRLAGFSPNVQGHPHWHLQERREGAGGSLSQVSMVEPLLLQ